MPLDRQHLELLRALTEHRTLRAAATSINLSPSAASRRLHDAERRVGVALTRTDGRALELTSAGRYLAEVARDADRLLTEAEVAARVLMELGVPRRVIHMEARSTSTQENARYCAMQVPARNVLLVSDAYHCFRARRVFGRYFKTVATAGSIHPRLWLRAKGALREVPVVLVYAILRWL